MTATGEWEISAIVPCSIARRENRNTNSTPHLALDKRR